MYISKIAITNFKCFHDRFVLELEPSLNILIGDNEAGKSTIIEAINLALSGFINGKYFSLELTQDLFNLSAIRAYLESLGQNGQLSMPPEIEIELFMDGFEDQSLAARLEGNNNFTGRKASGIKFWCGLDENHRDYYSELVSKGNVKSLPIECYKFIRYSFAREEPIIARSIPIKPAMINSARYQYVNGSDIYIDTIIKNHIEDSEHIDIAQAHRMMQDAFRNDEAIKAINEKNRGNWKSV